MKYAIHLVAVAPDAAHHAHKEVVHREAGLRPRRAANQDSGPDGRVNEHEHGFTDEGRQHMAAAVSRLTIHDEAYQNDRLVRVVIQ
jgi:hypothetical protein